MKRIASLFFIALLGGAFSLIGYFSFVEITSKKDVIGSNPIPIAIPTAFNNPKLIGGERTDFVTAAATSLDAVVHVKNTSINNSRDPFADFFYGRGSGRGREQVGTGSGVLISEDGYIITNNHVIDNASEIEITLNNKKTYTAELIGTDPTNDIALLKIEGESFHSIVFGNSDQINVGEWVLAVGNPYNLTSTVTAGIVSAKGRDLEGNSTIESFLQTDAAVHPVNSV